MTNRIYSQNIISYFLFFDKKNERKLLKEKLIRTLPKEKTLARKPIERKLDKRRFLRENFMRGKLLMVKWIYKQENC